jgi:SAM-dependent methyltransferase
MPCAGSRLSARGRFGDTSRARFRDDAPTTMHAPAIAPASLPHTLRERIRRCELDCVRPWLPAPARILELGGGSGYQAALLQAWGHDVSSVDVQGPHYAPHFPVQQYDGRHLPFPDASFDVVFSSNVLEHVEHLPDLLAEATRVLRPGGRMLHLLPGPVWRFWTSIAHYAWFVHSVCLRRRNPEAPDPSPRRPLSLRNLIRFAGRVAVPHAHGVDANACSELLRFSPARWRRVFRRSGWQLEHCAPAGIFYTGYKVLGERLDVPARQRLARTLGSACNLFVLTRSARGDPSESHSRHS